ncbi:MAG TPA: 23S rRNA (adenine(2503)-C(2))-methyltransferase RlmN [Gammaproteobacteria bacterium]|nr:23S rRNA (adenine(2503)-C(2))-methyltransferase RlmN [Gammaproteobacteria bacterium]
MVGDKINLLGLDRAALERLFARIGEQKYRAAQFMKALYHHYQTEFDSLTTFSKSLRAKMQEIASLAVPQVISEKISDDGTIKWLMQMYEGNAIETVYIPEKNRGTLCISSQIGCSLNCSFCATGAQGFNRHLSTDEIVGQVWVAASRLGQSTKNRKITNIVLMGMGEPLANYSNVLPALKIFVDDFGFGFANRRVTVSTSGMVPYIQQLNIDIDVSLAISLHAPNDELRNQLVPLNKKYNIKELLSACSDFIKDKRKAKITIEYTLIKGVNDQPEHARSLVKLLSKIPCKINLIPFNPFPGNDYQRPDYDTVEQFQNICEKSRIVTTVRRTRGDDIDAACGQLAGDFMDRTRRSNNTLLKLKVS